MQLLKCAHEPCTCTVEVGEPYCSLVCKEDASRANPDNGHNACRCRHTSCEAR